MRSTFTNLLFTTPRLPITERSDVGKVRAMRAMGAIRRLTVLNARVWAGAGGVGGARHLYTQGQSPAPNTREYFYYIDHQGMLFMDDAKIKNFTSCFKEKKFLVFFFKRLQLNDTGRYEKEFPYFSPCGREKNYVRCDDVPYVYTHVIPDPAEENLFRFCFGHAGDELFVRFEPDKMIMLPKTGRVYHPAPEKVGGIGLVKSSLAIEFSKLFTFGNSEENPPTHFTWNGKTHELVPWYDSLLDVTSKNST